MISEITVSEFSTSPRELRKSVMGETTPAKDQPPIKIVQDEQWLVMQPVGLGPDPQNIFFAARTDARLLLKKPFPVTMERQEATVIARADLFDEFGAGATTGEALDDLGKTIGELYFSLKQASGNLSPHLASLLALLQEHIQERHIPGQNEGSRIQPD